MRSRRLTIATVLLVVSSFLLPTARVAADQDALCGDVQLIHARGTGVPVDDAVYLRLNLELSNRLGIPPISYSTYQLGKDGGFGGFEYPADPQDDFGQKVNFFLQASLNHSLAYQDSRNEGVNELVAYLNHRVAQCPGELYVLTGHSQGADVTGRALAELPNSVLDRIAFVALFGDPRFQTYNLQVTFFSEQCYFPRPVWQQGTSECHSHGWFADDFAPYFPDALLDRAGSWCRDGDLACTGIPQDILTGDEHTKYDTGGDVDQAMQRAAAHLAALDPDMADDIDVSMLQFATGNAGADLAFVFDTTGSMWNEIDDVAAQASALAGLWLGLATNGRVALVEFRDQGDSFVSRVDLELTDDGAAFQAAVNALEADEGGDIPEAQLSGLMTTLNELDWQAGATKVAVVITDAPGKDPEPVTNFTRAQVSQRALEIDPVAIYGVDVFNDPGVTGFMQPLADDTAGEVFVLQPGQSLSDLLEGLLNTIAMSPVAVLHGPYFADIGNPVHFSAAGSFDPDGAIVSYEWDFDGNGSADQTTTVPVVDHTYSGAFTGFAAVRVVAGDGGEALATAAVTVQSGGLGPVAPVAPADAAASVTAPGEVSVTWTPAPDDHADGYVVNLDGTYVFRYAEAGAGSSMTITGLDLSEPQTFSVRAANEYGQSPATGTSQVGGQGAWAPGVTVSNDPIVDGIHALMPAVGLSTNSTAMAVWARYHSGTDYDIYASRRDPTSGAWDAPVRANDVTTGAQYYPAVAFDQSNNAFAVWVDERNGRRDIYFSKRTAATGVWSANVRVNSDTSFSDQTTPAIAVSSTAEAIAVWYRKVGSNKYYIYSGRLAAGASTWSTSFKVTPSQSPERGSPDVAIGPDGTAFAVWTQPRSGNADVWFASLAPGSTTWSSASKISDDPGTAFQGDPEIGVDGAGNLMVTWDDWRTNPHQVRARYRPAGGSWTASVVVGDNGSNGPSLSVSTNGQAFVVWQDGPYPPTGNAHVWGSSFDQPAGIWSSPVLLDDGGANDIASQPAVAINDSDSILIWQNGTALQSGGRDNQVWARWKD